jgi:DDE superfamily endonuclease
MIPGWPYSVIATLEPGRTSWTAVLDAVRLGPDDDVAEVTAAQVGEVIPRLAEAGHWREGDPPVLVIFDAGYDPMRLAHQLAGLPVEVLGRLRSDRVLHFPVPARQPGTNGRPPRHGREFSVAPGPAAGRRSAAALGTARPAGTAHPGPGPPRVQDDPALPGRCAETRQARPRPPARVKDRRPAPRHDVGKTTKRERSLKARRGRAG